VGGWGKNGGGVGGDVGVGKGGGGGGGGEKVEIKGWEDKNTNRYFRG